MVATPGAQGHAQSHTWAESFQNQVLVLVLLLVV